MTWQHLLIVYIAIGMVMVITVIGYHQFIKLKRSGPDPLDVVHEILRKHDALHKPQWQVRVDYCVEEMLAPAAAAFLGVIAWPLLAGMGLKNHLSSWRDDQAKEKAYSLQRQHLVERHNLEELEALERVTDPLGAVPDLPFGHLNAAWERFKRNLAPNDEVWSFSEPCETFGTKGIRSGYAILHNGEIEMFWVTGYRRVDEGSGDSVGLINGNGRE